MYSFSLTVKKSLPRRENSSILENSFTKISQQFDKSKREIEIRKREGNGIKKKKKSIINGELLKIVASYWKS